MSTGTDSPAHTHKMGDEITRKRRHANNGHRLQARAKRPRDDPTATMDASDEPEPHLRGGAGPYAGSAGAEGSHGDGSTSNDNKDIYYLFASDTIVCGIAEALRLPEHVLQKFPAATQNDKRYGHHVRRTLENLEMEVEPSEPLEQIVRSFIQHPTNHDANITFETTWDHLQGQKNHYAAQFSDISSGEQLDEESAKTLNTALANLQTLEVFALLRCWQGYSCTVQNRLHGDRLLRGVRMEWNRLQLLMDGYVLVHSSRPPSERNAKHGKVAQRARRAWIQEDSQWTFSDPLGSVHLVVGNGHRPSAMVLFQQPPNRPHTTLDDPRTINPPHVRQTATTSSSNGPQPPPTRRPLGNMGSQQPTSASTARLETLLVDLAQRVDNMGQQAQNEFSRLNREIGASMRDAPKESVQKGQRDRSPLRPLRRLSLSQLDEYGPSIPGQRPVPGPVRIFNAPGWRGRPPPSPEYLIRSPLPGVDPIYSNLEEADEPQRSPNYGLQSSLSLSSEMEPQGASTPKRFPGCGEEEHSTHEGELEGETSEAGPSGTQ